MDAPIDLKEVLAENRTAKLVEDNIHSVLPPSLKHQYDRRAAFYDLLVATRLYNSIMWGSSPLEYTAFARRAVRSATEGSLLDAGCGSMVFTAPAYLECSRPIIAFDQSLAMLRRARNRLRDLSGSFPRHILLLQADLSDLPFRPAAFQTMLFMNVLHHCEDAGTVIATLKRLLKGTGHFYLTSLVSNNRFIGDRYLRALYGSGQLARPRRHLELKEILTATLGEEMSVRLTGNMAFATMAQMSAWPEARAKNVSHNETAPGVQNRRGQAMSSLVDTGAGPD